ncbi:GNAT family N-acetyltransferase [Lacisediminihabitans sp.]|uniref:GNAT family N-acetyltransferase n=1 Tax=Lacisediminihabitans sp. TaxID=2787631 RepID=UPI002ED9DB35
MNLRPLRPTDLARLVELNDAAYPAVPITPPEEMTALLGQADFTFGVVDETDSLLGFLIGLRPGADYASENYRYFDSRGADFLYVDRIVIDATVRGAGLGRMLYDAVFALARDEARAEIDCEVNLDPPNPQSLAFHDRLGFRRVGEQETKNGTVTVALLAALL